MQKILNVNGIDYKIMSDKELTQEQLNTVMKKISNEPLNVRNTLESPPGQPLTLNPATCPTGTIYVGRTIRMSAVVSGGTAPYTVSFKVGGVEKKVNTLTAAGTTTFDYLTVAGDVGSKTYTVDVKDSCLSSTPGLATDFCNITVAACPPPTVTMTITAL